LDRDSLLPSPRLKGVIPLFSKKGNYDPPSHYFLVSLTKKQKNIKIIIPTGFRGVGAHNGNYEQGMKQ
jgi:hypothetical protein